MKLVFYRNMQFVIEVFLMILKMEKGTHVLIQNILGLYVLLYSILESRRKGDISYKAVCLEYTRRWS